MKQVLLWLWQLPQNLAGLLFLTVCRGKGWVSSWGVIDGIRSTDLYRNINVSLGRYIFLHENRPMDTISHEMGHCEQSKLLGPLYLPLIGLPSALGNIWNRVKKKGSRWYYSQPWEAWADRLGGVKREWT